MAVIGLGIYLTALAQYSPDARYSPAYKSLLLRAIWWLIIPAGILVSAFIIRISTKSRMRQAEIGQFRQQSHNAASRAVKSAAGDATSTELLELRILDKARRELMFAVLGAAVGGFAHYLRCRDIF